MCFFANHLQGSHWLMVLKCGFNSMTDGAIHDLWFYHFVSRCFELILLIVYSILEPAKTLVHSKSWRAIKGTKIVMMIFPLWNRLERQAPTKNRSFCMELPKKNMISNEILVLFGSPTFISLQIRLETFARFGTISLHRNGSQESRMVVTLLPMLSYTLYGLNFQPIKINVY